MRTRATDTIIVGAGQAGLAVSAELTRRGRDHLVVERGRLAERWRSERWDSLRLLTPNWMSRLPGWSYQGPDPDGFMSAGDLVDHLSGFAGSFGAPVMEQTSVMHASPSGDGFRVLTDQGTFRSRNLVVATGWCDRPRIPECATGLDPCVTQLVPSSYRNPGELPPGGVLVIGASASGVQIAEELARSGRRVVLSVGSHKPLPRSYRGIDIMWWLERIGAVDQQVDPDDAEAYERALREPSLQLAGHAPGSPRPVDLGTLQEAGVCLAGRLRTVDGRRIGFADDLPAQMAAGHRALERVIDRIEAHARAAGLDSSLPPGEPLRRAAVPAAPDSLDLRRAGIGTVIWATGYTRSYPWLHVPVLDERGDIRQRRGVTPVPGLYTAGMRFQTGRRSTFVDGVRFDAAAVVEHMTSGRTTRPGRLEPAAA